MDAYCVTLRLQAPAQVVYDALTTPAGLRGWWTETCEIATEVGQTSTFRFGKTFKVMRLEQLTPPQTVRWQCIASELHVPDMISQPHEWVGTSLAFRLHAAAPNITELRFQHQGLTPQLECYSLCTTGWNHFLDSLRAYVETGKGMPFVE